MSATQDVSEYLKKIEATPGQTVEGLAKRGHAWQAEIYSANAVCDLNLDWWDISEADRENWREWARKKFNESGVTPA